jgi:signal transduction histidine kinase/CheY-like chemotaxis protein
MSALFLSHSEKTFENTMTVGIRLIADALDLDRVSVWRYSARFDGLHGSQIYRWDKEKGGTTPPTKWLEDVSFTQLAPSWAEILPNGGEINSPTRLMTGREHETMKMLGCVSVFFTPVSIGGVCWGFVLFEDRRNERFFQESDVEIMRSAALLCTNTVIRAEMEREIVKTSKQLSDRLKRQVVMSLIMKRLIDNDSMDVLLNDVISKVGTCLSASRAIISQANMEDGVITLKNVWYAENAPKHLVKSFGFMDIFKKYFPAKLPSERTVPPIICELASESDQEEFKRFADIDIGGFILSPIYVEGELWGFLGIDQCNAKRVWTESETEFVISTTNAVSNAIMRELYNMQAKESLEKATNASKAKSEFLSNMSHEIRTPINSIVGMTTIGKNAADITRKDYCFSKIEDASKHLLGVINDVLDMSKIEANKFELSPIEFSFEKMLQRIAGIINFRISEKQQEFTVKIDKSIPKTLIGDDQRLAQVITNLISNAGKFTPEKGSIRLDTCFLGEENGVCTIQVSVSDSGIGISKEQLENLFHPFTQAEMNTTRKFGGTGLGLSISKSIVEMMGGKIWVESEIGKGSTFFFNVQIERGKDVDDSNLRGINWSNVKILAVDDDPEILKYFQDILHRYGVNCDIAENGEEAMKITKQNGGYNIYFVDWRMPEMDGIKLTTELKKNGYAEHEKAIVIMISSAELGAIEKEAKKAGVNKFLTKPLFPSAIVDILNEFLDVEQKQTDGKTSKLDGLLAGYHILLAEDVKVNSEILLALFEPTLLKIDCAENGLEAVGMFVESSDKYDMIFMDLQMPEMDGYEATKRIRAMNLEKAKNIPIIAMTANVFKEDVERCLKTGMNDHIGKPIDFDEVLEKMRKYLPKNKKE